METTEDNSPDVNDNLKIDEVKTNEFGMRINWSSDSGFGSYTIYTHKDGSTTGDSEMMDTNEDKKFLMRLLNLLADRTKLK